MNQVKLLKNSKQDKDIKMGLPKVSEKSTKKEILAAFNAAKKLIKVKPGVDANVTEIKAGVSDITIESIVNSVGATKGNVLNFLTDIEEKTLASFKKLQDIQDATQIAEKEMDRIHGIKDEGDALEALLIAQESQRENFHSEIQQARDKWAVEKKKILDDIAETKADEKKRHERLEEEFNYAFKKTKRVNKDDLDQQLFEAKRDFDTNCGETKQKLDEVRVELDRRDKDQKALKAKAEMFDKVNGQLKALKTESTTNTKQAEFDIKSIESARDADKRLFLNEIASLKERLENAMKENSVLKADVKAAYDGVLETTKTAVTAAQPKVYNNSVQSQAK